MLDLQYISDRIEIQDLLTAYCFAIDSRDWNALDDIFTENATIDYTEAGGDKGTLPHIKKYLARALKPFPGFQHMVSAPHLKIDGDTASSRCVLFNPIMMEKDGKPHTMFCGLWYRDKLVRTDKGWRISERYEEMAYFHNMPEDFSAVDV